MPDFTVARRGTDSSGRAIYTTAFFWQVWAALLRRPRVAPFADLVVIVQGAFMERAGGGAAASAGYHDAGGTVDIRTWNLSAEQERIFYWEAALLAIIFWPRGPAASMGGMDEHAHSAAGWDHPISSGIASQWHDAHPPNRGDGLAGGGPDYVKPRPTWVDFPPANLLKEATLMADDVEKILNAIADTRKELRELASDEQRRNLAEIQRQRDARKRTYTLLGGIADQLTELANDTGSDKARALRDRILRELAADPDVDGPDNPAADKVPT